MKKIKPIFIITLLLSLAVVFTVSAEDLKTIFGDKPIDQAAKVVSTQGITVNTINFSTLNSSELPTDIHEQIESLKKQKGFAFFQTKQGEIILAVFAGEKRTGGYSIEIVKVEDNEGITNVIAKEISPKSTDFVTMAFTYPYTVVKVSGVTTNFKITNAQGDIYLQLIENSTTKSESINHISSADALRMDTLQFITNAWANRLLELQEQMDSSNITEAEEMLLRAEWNFVWEQWEKYQRELDLLTKKLTSPN